ncbi:class I SAM-dependent methyltransferase [Desulfatirhabdium butyrativorans]|uniref:class I SAM-dependent methyltransferase n=1 Tax=Desulfatirhabdium butyrativorans TaxID=340467 RepID=UPI0004277483|nr:class I SAM-dependent methyltransferase [Desulfatirhabdium butyrativorans]
MDDLKNIYRKKAAFFDKQANEAWANEEYTPEEQQLIDRMLHMAGIELGCRILEPGCGTGRLTRILCLAVGESGYVLATDISPGMISMCRKRNAGFKQADIRCLSIESLGDEKNQFFDAALCHAVFPHFESPQLALTSIVNRLKISGRFIISHFMGSKELNDMHRKAGPVRNDMLPAEKKMRTLCESSGLMIEYFEDKPGCYLLHARKI